MKDIQAFLNPEVWLPMALPWAMRVAAALAIFFVGRWLARMLSNAIKKLMSRTGAEASLTGFIGNLVHAVLLAVVIIAALDTLGIRTTSLLAVLGAAGLAVGLALQGSLSNFAAGVMLMVFKPFKSGDWVDAAGASGTIEQVRVFNTIMRTGDNREITIPNKRILDDNIVNYSARDRRRIDLVIGIGYDDDIGKAKSIIEKILSEESRVLSEPAPVIMVLELGDSSVNLAVRPWAATSDYWLTRGDLLHRIKTGLEDAGLSIPYPQRDVHLIGQSLND